MKQGWSGYQTGDHMKSDAIAVERLKHYQRFICELEHPVLDIGEVNWIGYELGADDNTHGDLNYTLQAPKGEYKTILDLEVLEHLMNPLKHLKLVYFALADDGRLYLSTPLCPFFAPLIAPHHFSEYKRDRLLALFDAAGFVVVRSRTFRPIPWHLALTGIRPMLKWLFWRTLLVELEKK